MPKLKLHKMLKLREYLKENGAAKFARALNISHGHLSMIVNGKRRPSLPLANRMIIESESELSLKDLLPDTYYDVMKHAEKKEGK